MAIDPLSLISLYIQPCIGFKKLRSATGFIIQHNNKYYLATNKHVIEPINDSIPDRLCIWHYKKTIEDNIAWHEIVVPLYSECNTSGNKHWFEHPNKDVDVILLPIEIDLETIVFTLDLSLSQTDIITYPSLPVSLIGFPYGRAALGKLPIWVTGFIASDVDINDEQLFFYVNASGRSGLSGSPVILRLPFGYSSNKGLFISGDLVSSQKFMGIYSGRIPTNKDKNEDTYSSDICIVWKPIIFDQIFKKNL